MLVHQLPSVSTQLTPVPVESEYEPVTRATPGPSSAPAAGSDVAGVSASKSLSSELAEPDDGNSGLYPPGTSPDSPDDGLPGVAGFGVLVPEPG